MDNGLEGVIRNVYLAWKKARKEGSKEHPDAEDFCCLMEGHIDGNEARALKEHLIGCERCSEMFSLSLAAPKISSRSLYFLRNGKAALEIAIRVKDRFLDILHTSGNILKSGGLTPQSSLRSKHRGEFKDEVVIEKDFKDIKVQVKIENKGTNYFNAVILAKRRTSLKAIRDLRIALLREGIELESRIADSGSVVFEHILLGKYNIELSARDEKIAAVILDIKT